MNVFMSQFGLHCQISLPSPKGFFAGLFSRPITYVVILFIGLSLFATVTRRVSQSLQVRVLESDDKSHVVARHATTRNYGLTQVYPDPKEDATDKDVDIIAIHGLDTQAPRTWISWKIDGDRESGETHWLKHSHMLPSCIPKARIFTFDWNANLDKNAGADSLLGFADSLLEELLLLRQDGRNRPFIFIASCFGGLLLMKAIVRAAGRHNKYNEILDSTAGLVFLGTPFQGSHDTFRTAVQVRVLVALQASRQGAVDLAHYLSKNDASQHGELSELVQLFRETVTKPQFRLPITCFYERLDSDFTALRERLPRELSRLEVDGLKLHDLKLDDRGILVDKHSASLPGLDAIGLDVRHSMLNKFSGPENSAYRLVSSTLIDMVKKAHQTLSIRLPTAERPIARYQIVPHFSIAANGGQLQLGTVVTDLVTLRPLNVGDIVAIPEKLRFEPVQNHGHSSLPLSNLLQNQGGGWSKEYALQSIANSADPSSTQHRAVVCDALITTYFCPDQEYMDKNLSTHNIQDYLNISNYQEDIYMITGLKVAKKLQLSDGARPSTTAGRGKSHNRDFEPVDIVVAFRAARYKYTSKWKVEEDLKPGQMYEGEVDRKIGTFEEIGIEIEQEKLANDED